MRVTPPQRELGGQLGGLLQDDPGVMEGPGGEGLEPGEIAPNRYFGPAVEWPKVGAAW